MSGSLLPNGVQTFTGPNGTPLSGGLVHFYVPGTTTPKNTYQDAAQTILNSNPVALNANGQAIIYGTGDYRQIAYDEFGNLVWDELTSAAISSAALSAAGTQSGASLIGTPDGNTLAQLLTIGLNRVVDSVSALRALSHIFYSRAFVVGYYVPGDGGGGDYWYDPTDTTSADNGGTIIVAADGGRWKLAARAWIDVMEFGADPTATTDSTTAFMNALATGKLVRFKGNFMISGIALESGWALQGVNRAQSQLLLKSGANAHMFTGENVNDIVLKDFYANGNKADQGLGSANPWRGVYLDGNCSRIRLDNIQVDQCQDHGISLNDTSDTPSLCGVDSLIINCAATNCGSAAHAAAGGPGGTGIGGGADSLVVASCLAQSNYLNGFKSPSGNYTNCVAYLNNGGFETGFSTPTGYSIKLTACRAIQNNGSGFRHQGQGQWIEMNGCSAIGNAYSGIDALGGVNGLIVRGGYYLNNGTNGTRTTGSTGLDGISLHGETATDPMNVTIDGAQFFDNQSTKTQQYALYATGATTNVKFGDSNIVGSHAVEDVYLDPVASSNNFMIGNFMGSSAATKLRASVSSSGTGTTTLGTMTIPANRLVTGDTLRIKAAGRVTGTVGTKLIRLAINSTTVVFSSQSAAQQNPFVLDATLPIGANSIRTLNVNAPNASQTAVTFSTTSATLTIAINCTPAGGDIVTLDAFEVSIE